MVLPYDPQPSYRDTRQEALVSLLCKREKFLVKNNEISVKAQAMVKCKDVRREKQKTAIDSDFRGFGVRFKKD